MMRDGVIPVRRKGSGEVLKTLWVALPAQFGQWVAVGGAGGGAGLSVRL